MADDIAVLGIQVNTTPVKAAVADLNALKGAAQTTGAAVTQSTQQVNTATQQVQQNVNKMGQQIQKSAGLARHELINLGRQAQDVGVSLFSGQSPFVVLVQQGAQIGDVFASTKGTMAGFAQQLRGLITPALLLGTAIAGITVAVIAGISAWKSYAIQIDDLKRITGSSLRDIGQLQAAAGFKGIGESEFADSIKKASQSFYELKNNMGASAELFRANNVQAGNFNEFLDRAADLVQRASGNTEKQFAILRAVGLPATVEWVRLLESGSQGLDMAKQKVAELGLVMDQNLIDSARRFDEGWNKATTQGSLYFKTFSVAAVESIGLIYRAWTGLGRIIASPITSLIAPSASSAPKFGVGSAAGPTAFQLGSASIDPTALKQNLQLESQRISMLGELATVTERVRASQIALDLAILAGVPIKRDDAARIRELTRQQALGTFQIEAQVNALRIEQQTIGMGVGAAAAFRAEQEKVLEFRQRGIELGPKERAELARYAASLGQVTQELVKQRQIEQTMFDIRTALLDESEEKIANQLRGIYGSNITAALKSGEADLLRLNEQLRIGRNLTAEFASTLAQDFIAKLKEGATLWDAFGKAGLNALNRLATKMLDMAAQQLAQKAFGGIASLFGIGPSFGTATGTGIVGVAPFAADAFHSGGIVGIGGTRHYVHPAHFNDAPRYHRGIDYVGGERPAILKVGERVIAAGQNNQPQDVNITMKWDVTGYVSQEEVVAIAKSQANQAAAQAIAITSAGAPKRQQRYHLLEG